MLDIVMVPDTGLRKKSDFVQQVDKDILGLLQKMLKTMYAASGIGLAAIQVGYPLRLVVIDIPCPENDASREKTKTQREKTKRIAFPLFIINPKITWFSEETASHLEGCLSLPDYFGQVVRPSRIKLEYYDVNNQKKELDADGLLSVCIQHEVDHLDGVLFIDRMSDEELEKMLDRVRSDGDQNHRDLLISPETIKSQVIKT